MTRTRILVMVAVVALGTGCSGDDGSAPSDDAGAAHDAGGDAAGDAGFHGDAGCPGTDMVEVEVLDAPRPIGEAPIPGATVWADDSTGRYFATTGADGRARIPCLSLASDPPTITAMASGYGLKTFAGVEPADLPAGRPLRFAMRDVNTVEPEWGRTTTPLDLTHTEPTAAHHCWNEAQNPFPRPHKSSDYFGAYEPMTWWHTAFADPARLICIELARPTMSTYRVLSVHESMLVGGEGAHEVTFPGDFTDLTSFMVTARYPEGADYTIGRSVSTWVETQRPSDGVSIPIGHHETREVVDGDDQIQVSWAPAAVRAAAGERPVLHFSVGARDPDYLVGFGVFNREVVPDAPDPIVIDVPPPPTIDDAADGEIVIGNVAWADSVILYFFTAGSLAWQVVVLHPDRPFVLPPAPPGETSWRTALGPLDKADMSVSTYDEPPPPDHWNGLFWNQHVTSRAWHGYPRYTLP